VYRKVKKPSLSIAGSGKPLYFQRPPALESQTRPNLDKAMKDLVPAGNDVTVTSVTLPVDLSVLIEYSGELKKRKED
jgi:ubiquitin-activating enzyme E1 C